MHWFSIPVAKSVPELIERGHCDESRVEEPTEAGDREVLCGWLYPTKEASEEYRVRAECECG